MYSTTASGKDLLACRGNRWSSHGWVDLTLARAIKLVSAGSCESNGNHVGFASENGYVRDIRPIICAAGQLANLLQDEPGRRADPTYQQVAAGAVRRKARRNRLLKRVDDGRVGSVFGDCLRTSQGCGVDVVRETQVRII